MTNNDCKLVLVFQVPMQQFKDWFNERRAALVQRLAGDDPQKILRLYAAAVLLLGFWLGCLTTFILRPAAAFSLVMLGVLIGYSIRAFVSFRRRRAAWMKRSSRM